MLRKLVAAAGAALLLAIIAVPSVAQAKEGHFYGYVVHVSTQNIKVQDPQSKQTLSFLLVPKFQSVFSDDGKTTIQMAQIHPNSYVRIDYDQKFVGARHADKIIVMTKHNKKVKAMGS